MAFGGGSFTTNCLDDIPFKLGPSFRPPTKVVLPPDFQHSVQPKALKVEYTFEVEEAVLKWSAEKERQRLESEAAKLRQPVSNTPQDGEYEHSDSSEPEQPIYENVNAKEPLYENSSMLLPQPAPRPIVQRKPQDDSVNMMLPNPVIANISADILQPVPSYSSDENEEKNVRAGAESNEIDLKWFEKEDDPFNNLELQTINVMDELASVLEETKKSSPVPNSGTSNVVENGKVGCDETKSHADPVINNSNGNLIIQDDNEGESDGPEYENVEIKLVDLKNGVNVGQSNLSLANLPPIPPRRDLVGNQPLPPIGHSTSEPSFSGGSSIKAVNNSASTDNINDQIGQNQAGVKTSFQNPEVPKVMSSRRVALPKPPRTFTYSRHDMNDSSNLEAESEPNYDNVPQINIGNNSSVQFTNNDKPGVEKSVRNSDDDELNFDQHHFDDDSSSNTVKDTSRPRPAPRRPPAPPPRPSSQQSWNRYSPLPPTGSGSATEQSPRDGASVDLYNQLSLEAQSSVDKLAMMGFPKDRVVRAVDKLGRDEKEVVEYLCLVDQLIEKGYSICHSETALLMFKNSMNQACAYLELFTQMQELGFNGDKIKEALVNTNNDREKTLDILTASS